jgi:hypothetical protein
MNSLSPCKLWLKHKRQWRQSAGGCLWTEIMPLRSEVPCPEAFEPNRQPLQYFDHSPPQEGEPCNHRRYQQHRQQADDDFLARSCRRRSGLDGWVSQIDVTNVVHGLLSLFDLAMSNRDARREQSQGWINVKKHFLSVDRKQVSFARASKSGPRPPCNQHMADACPDL